MDDKMDDNMDDNITYMYYKKNVYICIYIYIYLDDNMDDNMDDNITYILYCINYKKDGR